MWLPAISRAGQQLSPGGTSAMGSKACRWAAKPRTTPSRCAHHRGVASFGRTAHDKAASVVTVVAPAASK
jgi:hypothetical protein